MAYHGRVPDPLGEPPTRWLLLVYRVPSGSSRSRVAVWRELKRLGVLYLQQAVCVLPDLPEPREALEALRERISEMGGTSLLFDLSDVADAEQAELVKGFRAGSAKEYDEIVEECDTKFVKEIEFERFRENYTFEESEEIRQDLEKLQRWLAKIEARDWVGAPGRDLARTKVADCEALLEEFENDVFQRIGEGA